MKKTIGTLFLICLLHNCFSEYKAEIKSIVCDNILGSFLAYPSLSDQGIFIITEEAFTKYSYSFKFFDITTQKLHDLCSYSDEEKVDPTDRPLCFCTPGLNNNNQIVVICRDSNCLVIKSHSSEVSNKELSYELTKCAESSTIDSLGAYNFRDFFDQEYNDNNVSIYITDSILVYVDGKKRTDFKKFKTVGFKYFKKSKQIITLSFVHAAHFKEDRKSDFECEINFENTSEEKFIKYEKMFEDMKSNTTEKQIIDLANNLKWVLTLLVIVVSQFISSPNPSLFPASFSLSAQAKKG